MFSSDRILVEGCRAEGISCECSFWCERIAVVNAIKIVVVARTFRPDANNHSNNDDM
jgi:hypothetical protein